ncbi:MAG: tetratricopeptide repeat protein [Phycisphaerales bacterium]|nr:tetratricopeptide repeat protein [Phycisphaerales bacterium]
MLLGAAALLVLACGLPASGQGVEADVPDLSQAALRRMEAPYLTDEERRDLRIFHGLWQADDIDGVAERARVALLVGDFDDASLLDEGAAPEDRAEAAVYRGDLQLALDTLVGRQSMRARRVRAEALEGLGRFGEADAAIDPVVSTLMRNRMTTAADLHEGVRALIIRARLQGRSTGDYKGMMQLLAKVHQEMDRLYWPALLTEAELLHDKNNHQESQQAIGEVLKLNPSAARAWYVIGLMHVETFGFDQAESIAAMLDRLARRLRGHEEDNHPWADIIRARIWMRQNDPAEAGRYLERVLERYPKMREARALDCAIAALRFDEEGTSARLAAFDELSAGSPVALYEVGRTLSDARQYDAAASYLEQASSRQPNWAQPIIELGLLEMQSGNDERAQLALTTATRLDEFNVRARNSLTLIESLLEWDTIESEHFVVRYQPGDLEVMAREMLEPLEVIHHLAATAFDHEPDRRTVIELMPDHEWFGVRITGMPAIHTIAACTGPVIAMEVPREGARHFGVYDWVRVIRHEYVHTITLSRTQNRIPHWFTEAAAVWLEGAPRDYTRWQLLASELENGTLFDMTDINIGFIRPKRPQDRSLAYAQGHWMYEFIVERWGERSALDLMDLYASGVREEEAMCMVLGRSREEFHQQFLTWARHDAASAGMLPSPSIRELRLQETLSDEESAAELMKSMQSLAAGAGHRLGGGVGPGRWAPELAVVTPARVDWWLQSYPDHPDLLEYRVRELLEFTEGKPTAEYIPQLEAYARARPVDDMPHRHLARLYLDTATPEKAIPHLEYLDAREQHSPAYAIELARQYAALGEFDKAAAKAERATRIAPFDADYREFAATVDLRDGNLAGAERHILALTELEPNREIHRKRLEKVREMRGTGAGERNEG